MKITIDTSNLSELDISMLAFLADQGEAAEDEAEETPAPAPAPEPKKAKAAPKKPEPEPEPETEDDEPEAEGAPTMSDAVAAATQLVSAGEAAKVKAALSEVGAKRVSEVADDDIAKFLSALEG